MATYDVIRVVASQVPKGASEAGVLCPFCNGGRSNERSMSITHRDDGVKLYICHRAKCGAAGRINPDGYVPPETPEVKEFEPRFYAHETIDIDTDLRNHLWRTYQIGINDIKRFDLKMEKPTLRLVIPIKDSLGRGLGHESRMAWSMPGPKTLHYKVKDVPWMGWFFWPTSDLKKGVLLVEDVLSAIKCCSVMPTVSLMGSHLTLAMLMEVLKDTDNIILALDKDATEKAWKFKKKFQFIAPSMRIMCLERDLKYEDIKTIKGLLDEALGVEPGVQ